MSSASKERRRKAREALHPAEPWPERRVEAKVNVYTCPECHTETVTIDVHRGVTSFLLHRPWAEHAEGCDEEMARSSFYRPRPGHGPPTIEWYLPERAEAKAAGPAMFDHAQRGGLFLRRRSPRRSP